MFSCKFLLDIFRSVRLQNWWLAAGEVKERSEKNRVLTLLDMMICGMKYGAGYHDYVACGFENLKGKERKTYLTRGKNNVLVKRLNDPKLSYVFEEKSQFNKTFSAFLGRDWLDLSVCSRDELERFANLHETAFLKPIKGTHGDGVKKLLLKETMLENLFGKPFLLEEKADQHKALCALYPHAVNTVRVVTVCTKDEVYLIYAFLRMGSGGNVVDNFNAGGICAPVDLKTGKLSAPACDKQQNIYYTHPDTGVTVEGFQIPLWDEVQSLCKRAARKLPEVGYVGWDVCICRDKAVLIEGNDYPGHDILQLPVHRKNDKTGVLPLFQKIIPRL